VKWRFDGRWEEGLVEAGKGQKENGVCLYGTVMCCARGMESPNASRRCRRLQKAHHRTAQQRCRHRAGSRYCSYDRRFDARFLACVCLRLLIALTAAGCIGFLPLPSPLLNFNEKYHNGNHGTPYRRRIRSDIEVVCVWIKM